MVVADAAGVLMYNCVSSAYECAVRRALATILNNSAVYNRNSNGPRTEPDAESQQHDNRQTTSVEDLLSAPVEKRRYPGKCCTTYAERLLQTTDQDIMVSAISHATVQ